MLLIFLLGASTFCFAQKYHIQGWSEIGPCYPNPHPGCVTMYPLVGQGGQFLQWNVPLYSGSIASGSYDGLKKDVCAGATNCYWADGQGNWKFRWTSWYFCKKTCTYTATGDLVRTVIYLDSPWPAGTTVTQLWAVLSGTYEDESGKHVRTGIYNSYTAPVSFADSLLPQDIEQGGVTVVLADN